MSDWHFSRATWSAFGLDDEALELCINTLRREQAKRRKEAYGARQTVEQEES